MWVANRLALLAAALDFELCVVGIPKTIDNDLYGTDHAPGYGSAARFMALAARDAGLDLEAMATFDDVVIFEAFGRDTGWLAAASGLLRDDDDDAPHLIYTPEMAFDMPRFLDDVARIHARLGRVFITAAEGLPVAAADSARDALGRAVYSLTDGVGAALARQVRDRLELQVRVLRPNTIGRSLSACVSAADRAGAVQAGAAAATALIEGRSGLMAGLDAADGVVYVPLETAAGAHRPLPRVFLDADGTAVTAAFRAYALPLIGSVPPTLRLRRAHSLAGQP
jgi:6-phosphofructokinase 1